MKNKAICVYGCELWIKYDKDEIKKSTEYFEGAFKSFFCNYREEKCPFRDPNECDKYLKLKNE